jgi:methionine salvage enolase-phosphatase E1
VGDLRPYLCGFYDTTSGPKLEPSSYKNIVLSLGTDSPAEVHTHTRTHAHTHTHTRAHAHTHTTVSPYPLVLKPYTHTQTHTHAHTHTHTHAQVLFATDVLGEAQAAQAAGLEVVLVDRPGNKPLPEGHGFRVITSMSQLLL